MEHDDGPRPWRFPALEGLAGLAHGVTTRAGGVSTGDFARLNVGRSTPDAPEAVAENRRRAAAALGFASFTSPRQVHGTRLVEVRAPGGTTGSGPGGKPASEPGEADGLFTDVPGVLLGVLGADCPGVLLVDPTRRALAVVHAGWRGVAAGIVPAAVARLRERYGCDPQHLWVAVGPGIGQDAFEVGPEVAEALERSLAGAAAALRRGRGDRWHADLGAVIAGQAVAAGVRAGQVSQAPHCTHRDGSLFFSHRRDGTRAGRHALLAGWALPRDGAGQPA
ncbi:MAG: peptidoglycan editing factor PgeF [Planctomycetia bacterium]